MSISFPAPCESPQIRALLEVAEGDGVDATLLHEILWLTTAHAELKAFHMACMRLIDIIHSLPPSWDDLRHEAAIDPWLPVLNWVTGHGDRLAEAVGQDFLRVTNSTGHNPIRGSGVDEFPFYAVLCEPIPVTHPPHPYWLLTGHLLLGYVTALREEGEPEAYHRRGPECSWKLLPNGVDSAARAVRRLFEVPNYDLLSKLEVTLPPEQFADALEHGAIVEDASLERDRHNLYRFLQKCLGSRNWRDSETLGGSGGNGGHEWVGGRVSVIPSRIIEDSDLSANWGSLQIARFRSVSSRKANAQLRTDLSPDEYESDEEVALGDNPCGDTIANPGALARTTRAKSRALVRSNQLLGWSYEQLTTDEVQTLTKLLSKKQETLLQKGNITASIRHQQTQVLLAIKAMVATGSDIQRVSGMLIGSASKTAPDGMIAVDLVNVRGKSHAVWRIPALRPPYKTDLQGSVEQLRPEASCLEYADPLDAAPLVEILMQCNSDQSANGRMFSLEVAVLAERIAEALKRLGDNGGRISLTKVANTLWHAAYRVTGDAAVASCITGTPHPLARVRLHYTSIPTSVARKTYVQVFESLLGRPCPDNQHELGNSDTRESFIGARLCPTPEAVGRMFVRLRGDVEATRNALNRAEFVTHHNLLTLFATLHFAYATSCRAIVSPYLPLAAIDIKRQLATLSDKDDECRHKTRLVWIPRALLDTMLAYEVHLDSLKAQLPGLSRGSFEAPCFFLDDDMKPLPVRPKTLEPLLQPYLNVRANTHRRFLRSELLLRGCNPEVIDAFMGHWHAGEEPFSPYSTFNFASYTRELRTFLEPLLAVIGLDRPIAGRLAR